MTPELWVLSLFAEFVCMAWLLLWTVYKRVKADMRVRELEKEAEVATQTEMAEDPDNPYKIVPAPQEWFDAHPTVAAEPDLHAVLNPDGTTYGVYNRDGAEWWAAHLYWEYRQLFAVTPERRAERMLTGQEA